MKKDVEKKNVKKDKVKINKKVLIGCLSLILLIIVGIGLFFILRDTSTETIQLEVLPKDIYEWKCDIKDNKIVKLDNKKVTGDTEDKNGGIVYEKYTFKALKSGKTTMTFTYTNTQNGSFGEIKYYDVVVDKNLSLTIKERNLK